MNFNDFARVRKGKIMCGQNHYTIVTLIGGRIPSGDSLTYGRSEDVKT
jgi:hypothetical protein